jgi:hypothetical protein
MLLLQGTRTQERLDWSSYDMRAGYCACGIIMSYHRPGHETSIDGGRPFPPIGLGYEVGIAFCAIMHARVITRFMIIHVPYGGEWTCLLFLYHAVCLAIVTLCSLIPYPSLLTV